MVLSFPPSYFLFLLLVIMWIAIRCLFSSIVWTQTNKLFFNIFQFTDEEIEQSYEEFYEDVHTEFLKFGELVNFKVLYASFYPETTWFPKLMLHLLLYSLYSVCFFTWLLLSILKGLWYLLRVVVALVRESWRISLQLNWSWLIGIS